MFVVWALVWGFLISCLLSPLIQRISERWWDRD